MAKVDSIEMNDDDKIFLRLLITREEYKLIQNYKNVIVISEDFNEKLTTGKLGNSNRVMLPKKILKMHKVKLTGKVPARIFELEGKKLLLIKLEEKITGVPEFGEGD